MKNITKKGAGKAARKQTATIKRPTLDECAKAIIKDWNRYDVDTRQAVGLALKDAEFSRRETNLYTPAEIAERERELRDVVTRAKAGERVTESGAGAECDAVARDVIDLFDMSGIPDFLLSGIIQLLQFASEATGAKLWIEVEGDDAEPFISADVLARMCLHDQTLLIEIEPKKDLAALLSAVLNHPDTPASVHNDLGDALGSLPGFDHATNSAEHIRVMLAYEEVH
jgi:hypothetical protein